MEEYGAKEIKILKDLEAVRKRPSMYIGSTGPRGLHHLIHEVVDNSIDEVLAGYCKNVEVILHRDGSVSVVDDGRGIPVDVHPEYGKSALELVLTTLHSGGKFDHKIYRVAGGLHGVGISVVNALSEWLEAKVMRKGKIWRQRYKRGVPVTGVEVVGEVGSEKTGTWITFKPDPEIFEIVEFDSERLSRRLRELAFLNEEVTIRLLDERTEKEEVFHFEGGIKTLVKYLNQNRDVLFPEPIYFRSTRDGVELEVAIQYHQGFIQDIFAFVNDINTEEGGTHLSGFKAALTRVINEYANREFKEGKFNLQGEDVREGLCAVLSLKLPNPQFEGQTKTKLGNTEVRGMVESFLYEGLSRWFEENPSVAKKIIQKAILASRVREAAQKARELTRKKETLGGGTLPGKLTPCSEDDPSRNELFIVEGESAGGSAKQGRDRRFQAILPLRGKILNVEKSHLARVLSSEEIRAIITAVGTGIKDDFDPKSLRYHKIILMTDADVDGAHIRTLLLTFFYRYMPELILGGHIYIAQPPLYRAKVKGKEYFLHSEEELERLKKEVGEDKIELQRYKGLGEMNPGQLYQTSMNPLTRTIYQVTLEDAVAADELFTILMGGEVEPRRKFIQEHALEVTSLDI